MRSPTMREMKRIKEQLPATVRCLTSWRGTLALERWFSIPARGVFPVVNAHLSFLHTCVPKKARVSNPNPSKQPRTRESDHLYVMPAHCKANKRHTKADIRSEIPTGSNFQNSSLIDILDVLDVAGAWKDEATKTIARNPIATKSQHRANDLLGVRICNLRRLIQKQKRHVNLSESVKIPPSKGPATDATPNMLVTSDI